MDASEQKHKTADAQLHQLWGFKQKKQESLYTGKRTAPTFHGKSDMRSRDNRELAGQGMAANTKLNNQAG